MGVHEGHRGTQYSQLFDEEQSVGSEKTQVANDDQERGNEDGLYYDIKELGHYISTLVDM
jgi:hypothetical protein